MKRLASSFGKFLLDVTHLCPVCGDWATTGQAAPFNFLFISIAYYMGERKNSRILPEYGILA